MMASLAEEAESRSPCEEERGLHRLCQFPDGVHVKKKGAYIASAKSSPLAPWKAGSSAKKIAHGAARSVALSARDIVLPESRDRAGSSASTISSPPETKKPAPVSSRLTIPEPVYYRSPDFAVAMEIINSETLDMDKLAAWIAKEGRWSKAHISGNIEEVWELEEEELKEKYGSAYDDFMKEGEILDPDESADSDLEYESSEEEEEEEDEEGGFLCAIICDFLCDLPRPSNQLRDREIIGKVLAECAKNHQAESQFPSDPPRKDTVQIDLRGLCSEDAQKTLRANLFRLSREPQPFLKYLNVIVGCSMHGIGEGKLRQTVIDLLKAYENFKWTEVCNDAIISISLEDSVGWMGSDFAEDDETNLEEEEVEPKEKPELCTVICDFLSDLPSNQRPDRRIARKVLAGLKCGYGGDCGVDEDTMCIDIRGLYVDDVEDVLIDHLYELTFQSTIKYLNVTVGCIMHGVGKRNLGRAVVGIVMRDETIKWKEYHSGAVISIEIDRMKDYRNIGWNSAVVHEVQALTV